MRTRSVLAILAAMFAFTACGGDDTGVAVDTTGNGATSSPTIDPETPVSSPDVPAGSASDVAQWQRTEPKPGAIGIHTIAFDPGQAEPTDDGLLVRFYGGVEPCYVLDRADVVETPTSVTVTLYGGAPPSAVSATCIDIAVGYEVLVPLDVPVGDRTVIDGSV